MEDQFYTIQVGTRKITEDLLNLQTQDDIKIIPVVHGNFFSIILGGVLTSLGSGSTVLGLTLGKMVAPIATAIGTSMLVDGVTTMLTPQQSTMSPTSQQDSLDPAALASNYSFTGLTNISNAGVPVNLVYGEILVGSIVVSNGVDTVQVEGNN